LKKFTRKRQWKLKSGHLPLKRIEVKWLGLKRWPVSGNRFEKSTMKQFQLSVFYHGYFLSYAITTDDDTTFHFALKSAPEGAPYAPANFIAMRTEQSWTFDAELDTDFKKAVVHVLKRAKV